jgi:hypothetical protein
LAEQQITEIPIENVMNLYGIKITKETPDEYWGEAYPKYELEIEVHEALTGNALQASMAVQGLLTGLVASKNEYAHAGGTQYEQTP